MLIEVLEARKEALNVHQVTELLKVSERHIYYELVADELVPAFHVGRMIRSDPQDAGIYRGTISLGIWAVLEKYPSEIEAANCGPRISRQGNRLQLTYGRAAGDLISKQRRTVQEDFEA